MTTTLAEPAYAVRHTGNVSSSILRAPFEAKTWKAFTYVLVAVLLAALGVTYLYLGFGAGLLLAVTLIGLPLLISVILGGRVWGRIYRSLAATLLDTHVDEPPPFQPAPGLGGWVKGGLTDRAGWRGIGFVILASVTGLVGGYAVLVFMAMSVFTAISPIPWALFHPTNVGSDGAVHHSMLQLGDFYFETWPRMLALSAVGIVCCFIAPWPIRGLAALHRILIQTLLGPTEKDRRVVQLEQTRTSAVEDSAATLRRVERDLHDGTQARLVTMAMALGRAEEKLAKGDDATALISDAHATAKDALRELREMVRGIHPPALDLGLGPALETLTSRCAVPVALNVDLPTRPSPGVEAIAYFSVAELLTNVTKHANATQVWVTVDQQGANVVVAVRDNGIGGANPAAGTGLTGLAGRAATVDGTLHVDSPAGGPTLVTIALPASGSAQ